MARRVYRVACIGDESKPIFHESPAAFQTLEKTPDEIKAQYDAAVENGSLLFGGQAQWVSLFVITRVALKAISLLADMLAERTYRSDRCLRYSYA